LLHDRDAKFCESFRELIESGSVKPIRLPARSPNLNSYAERWVRSVKEECLAKLILVGESSLRRALRQYLLHYHEERNHHGKRPPAPHLSSASAEQSALAQNSDRDQFFHHTGSCPRLIASRPTDANTDACYPTPPPGLFVPAEHRLAATLCLVCLTRFLLLLAVKLRSCLGVYLERLWTSAPSTIKLFGTKP